MIVQFCWRNLFPEATILFGRNEDGLMLRNAFFFNANFVKFITL